MVRTGSRARALVTMMGAASLLATGAASAQQAAPMPRPSVNLYGQPGLIDLPSAEMMPDGEVTGSYSYFGGTHRRNLTFQVLPRLSATVRHATIADWGEPGDPSEDLTDRSLDLTFQLLREEGWRPGVAVGLRDVLGTGTYSSEFIVATKRVTPAVTVSAGVGWGRLGSSGSFGNPFCDLFGGGACDREEDYGDGGDIAFDRFFRGEDAAPFAGIEWRTPLDGLTLKAEYSPDDYTREQESPAADFERESRLNFGAEYRVTSGITLGGYWMYGSEVGVNLSVSANPFRPLERQDLAPGPIPVTARAADAPRGSGWAANAAARGQLGAALAEALEGEGVRLEELRVTGTSAEVLIVNERLSQDPMAIGRTVRLLQTGLPASVETMAVTLVRDGLPVTTTRIDRATYEGLIDRPLAGERMWQEVSIESAGAAEPGAGIWRPDDRYPDLEWSIFPVPFVIDRGDDKVSAGLTADAAATWHMSPEFSISGRVSQLFLGRSSDPGPSDSALPPVRSESARYYAGYEPRLARLTADYVTKLSDDVYARASAGYLERMFAGVSGEVLWKPSTSPIGFGVEVNYVAQRDNEGLGLGEYDYDVATGHASLYWDTGWNGFEVQLDAGRYLAGDWGSTLRVTRHFPNGWAFGAYATLTDVSTEDFGDGNFDKGVTLEIPLRWATPFETRARTGVRLGTGARDGGARLDVANRLYDTVRELDENRLERNWGAFWQ